MIIWKNRAIGIITGVLMISMLITMTGCWGYFTGCLGCLGKVAEDIGAVVGSGELETQEMGYTDFTKLEVGSAFEVEVIRADTYSVSITADDNLFEYLNISQSGETLKIGLKMPWRYVSTTQVASIAMPELYELDLSGASEGKISGFESSHSFKVNVSGASSLAVNDTETGDTEVNISGASKVSGEVEMANAEFDISGASRVELEGSASDLDIEVSGGSRAELAEFRVENAKVELSGASKGAVYVSGELDVELSGASRLDYYGDPVLDSVNISGTSSLNKK
ncbi:head GIN domain-containing protein [Chloroflexota bacterium]